MIHADYLFLLTDVDGLYTANPRRDPDARQIEVVESISAIRQQGIVLPLLSLPTVADLRSQYINARLELRHRWHGN
jgi:uridylate kinase